MTNTDNDNDTLSLGGMTLTRLSGGVEITERHGTGYLKLENADIPDIIKFLGGAVANASQDTGWHEAGEEADYRWRLFRISKTPLNQAEHLVHLSNAMHDLRTFLPGYEYESDTLPWEREDDD